MMSTTSTTATRRPYGPGFTSKLDLMGIRLFAPVEGEGAGGDESDADQAEADAAAAAAAGSINGDEPIDGEEQLADPGKKALDSMKAKWKAEQARANAAEQARLALQAKLDGKEQEHSQSVEQKRVQDEALAKANERIVKANVRAAAAGKLNDPADALTFIDLSSIEVGEDGEVDADTIAAAIDELITKKPYLAAQGGSRFQGSGDGGARNGASRTKQLAETDLANMTPDQIVAARKAGQLDRVMGVTK